MPIIRRLTSGLLSLFFVNAFATVSAADIPAVVPSAPVAVQDFKEPIRVACVGDSITQGAGTEGGNS